MLSTTNNTSLCIVVVEWNGEKPPTSWYNFVNKLTGKVKNKRWNQRGDENDVAIIVQEAVYLCQSPSLARLIAHSARYFYGEKVVENGGVLPDVILEIGGHKEALSDTEQMRKMQGVLDNTLRQRGPKPPPDDHVVTCLEEMRAFEVFDSVGRVFRCPNCGGVRVKVRRGKLSRFKADRTDDVMGNWLRSRFHNNSHWEPTELVNYEAPALPSSKAIRVTLNTSANMRIADSIMSSPDIVLAVNELVDTGDIDGAMKILDAVYVARTHYSPEERENPRLSAITDYVRRGGKVALVNFQELPVPDLFDTWLLGRETAVSYALGYLEMAHEEQGSMIWDE